MHTAGPLAAAIAMEAAKITAAAKPSGATALEIPGQQSSDTAVSPHEETPIAARAGESESVKEVSVHSETPQELKRQSARSDPLSSPPAAAASEPNAASEATASEGQSKASDPKAPPTKEERLLSDILKDVARTNPELAFF